MHSASSHLTIVVSFEFLISTKIDSHFYSAHLSATLSATPVPKMINKKKFLKIHLVIQWFQ